MCIGRTLLLNIGSLFSGTHFDLLNIEVLSYILIMSLELEIFSSCQIPHLICSNLSIAISRSLDSPPLDHCVDE